MWLCLVFLTLGTASSGSVANTCSPRAILSPFGLHSTIADITIVNHMEDEGSTRVAALAHVSKTYQGPDLPETITLSSPTQTADFFIPPNFFPIGSRMVVTLRGPDFVRPGAIPVNELGLYICDTRLDVIEDEVVGYIEDQDCPYWQRINAVNRDVCEPEEQRMPLEAFDIAQRYYFRAAEQSVSACVGNTIESCPRTMPTYNIESGWLNVPYLALVDDQSSRERPAAGELSLLLRIVAASNGQLVLEPTYTIPFAGNSPWTPNIRLQH